MDDLALLRLQIDWGADEALEAAPVDRLRLLPAGAEQGPGQAESAGLPAVAGDRAGLAPAAAPPASARPAIRPLAPAATAATPAERATAAAGQAQTIDELRAALAGFDGCALRHTAAKLVFAAGDPAASVMLVGDQPGEAEDRSGTPFAGADGVLLDRMLASIGLRREAMLLTPLVPWRPPGGRVPNPAEIAVCLPFLHRLVALAAPRRLVVAGPLAARALLGATRRRAAPAWVETAIPGNPGPIPALLLPSPALVAQTPVARRDAWTALRLLRRALDADLAKS